MYFSSSILNCFKIIELRGVVLMKKYAVLVAVLISCFIIFAACAEQQYPVYGRCIGEKVNVRVKPESVYPSYGRLIHDAPVTILGENGDTYYCSTAKGKGYIPKLYIEFFEGMTYQEFKEYCRDNPSEYRKLKPKPNNNKRLLALYKAELITADELINRCSGTAVFVKENGKLIKIK